MATAAEILGQVESSDPLALDTPPAPPAAETPPPVEVNDGRQRDERGRFVASASDAPPADPTPAPEPPTPEAKTETPAPETPAAAEPPATPEAADIEPFQFRGSGHDITIEGAMYKKGHGVFVPEQAMDDLRIRLTHAAKFPKLRERAERAEAQIRSGITRHQAENTALVETLGFLLDPDALTKWLQAASADPSLAAERLSVALQRKHIDIERKYGGQIVEAPKEGEPDDAAVLELQTQLDDTFQSVMSRIWPDATAEQRHAVEQVIGQSYQSFLTRAVADDPHGRWVRGQVIPAQQVMESFVRGERVARQAPQKPASVSAPTPPKPVPPAKPQPAPPALGGPAKNIAGPSAGKPKPATSAREAMEYFGLPTRA